MQISAARADRNASGKARGQRKDPARSPNVVADAQTILNQASEESPVILIASSMGAFISINLANRFPGRDHNNHLTESEPYCTVRTPSR